MFAEIQTNKQTDTFITIPRCLPGRSNSLLYLKKMTIAKILKARQKREAKENWRGVRGKQTRKGQTNGEKKEGRKEEGKGEGKIRERRKQGR